MLLFSFLLFFFGIALACGPIVHNEVTHRALYWFGPPHSPGLLPALEARQPFLQSGSFFPDFAYGCRLVGIDMVEYSQLAHWPPFYRAAATYFWAKYGSPGRLLNGTGSSSSSHTRDGLNLLAFLFGGMSHSTADIGWHSLGIYEGFIRATAAHDFDGFYDPAHHHDDNGGEFVAAHGNPLSYLLDEWSVPADDLVEIFKLAGKLSPSGQPLSPPSVSALRVDECMAIGFAAVQAIRVFGWSELFDSYAARSPFLNYNLDSYFLAGVDDMAAAVTRCWTGFWHNWMARNESQSLEVLCRTQNNHMTENWRAGVVDEVTRQFSYDQLLGMLARKNLTVIRGPARGHFQLVRKTAPAAVTTVLAKKSRQAAAGPKAAAVGASRCEDYSSLPVVARLQFPGQQAAAYARFGSVLAAGDFNNDSRTDLVVAAPDYGRPSSNAPMIGCVFVYLGGGAGVAPDQQLCGEQAGAKFGSSLAVVDLNADGVDDLAVSSPSYNAHLLQYDGRVFVYFGAGSRQGQSASPPFAPVADIVFASKQRKPWPVNNPSPPQGQFWSFEHTVFGSFLRGQDVDGDGRADLIVGAPRARLYSNSSGVGAQRGFVATYYARSGFRGFINDSRAAADWLIDSGSAWLPIPQPPSEYLHGGGTYPWLGESAIYLPSIQSMVVSAPDYPPNGLMFLFDRGAQTPRLAVQGTLLREQLGAALGGGDDDTLLIWSMNSSRAAPALEDPWQTGRLRAFPAAAFRGRSLASDPPVPVDSLPVLWDLAEDKSGAYFGRTIERANTDATATFMIASPRFTTDFACHSLLEPLCFEAGRLYAWNAGSPPANKMRMTPLESSDRCFDGDQEHARLGESMVVLPKFFANEPVVAIASPRWTTTTDSGHYNRLSGRVDIISLHHFL